MGHHQFSPPSFSAPISTLESQSEAPQRAKRAREAVTLRIRGWDLSVREGRQVLALHAKNVGISLFKKSVRDKREKLDSLLIYCDRVARELQSMVAVGTGSPRRMQDNFTGGKTPLGTRESGDASDQQHVGHGAGSSKITGELL